MPPDSRLGCLIKQDFVGGRLVVQQRVSSRKKGGQPSTAPQRHKSATGESTCGWCEKVIAEDDTWPGDVEVAVWLCAPIRKGARVLCRRCSERLPDRKSTRLNSSHL